MVLLTKHQMNGKTELQRKL